MKLIVGLGNPEPEYTWTRHNTGKDVLNEISEKFAGNEYKVLKNEGHMNTVGQQIGDIARYNKIDLDDLLIIYDELDLPVGEFKLAKGKGSKIHNGIKSVNQNLGSDNYWHLRVGVRGDEIPGISVQKSGRDPSKYVVQKFPTSDRKKLVELADKSLLDCINEWLSKK